MKIDLNCDLGEGVANEHLIMPYITSCNIACGGHFGDENTIDKTLKLAIQHKVKIGAHPSFPDKENFGRKRIQIADKDLKTSLQNQLDLFEKRANKLQVKIHHIKPHGALYNAIAVDENLAVLFVDCIKPYLNNLYLYVPYNSVIEKVALKNGIKIKYEVFADRNYNDDVTLVSRVNNNALILEESKVLEHVLLMIKSKMVKTISGSEKTIKADTICVHGDTTKALNIVKYLHQNLQKQGVIIG